MIVMLAFLTSVIGSEAQTTLTTGGNVGGALTTDNFGIITNFTSGTNLNDNRPEINWLVYSSSFVVLNGGNPLEVNNVNADLWDGNPAPPVVDGFFIPNRFEDWIFTGPADNEWHTTLEYHAAGVDLLGAIGYKLVEPSPTLGNDYVEWTPTFQFTNVGDNTLTIKPFRYLRINGAVSQTTIYSNHGGNLWDNDNTDGTSDDFVVASHIDPATNPFPAFYFSGFPMARYRVQAYNPPNDIHTSLTGGVPDFDLVNATNAVVGTQGEIGFQYSSESLEPNQAILYWLYPKPIKVNNSATNYPIDIDWETKEINAAQFNADRAFANTDVSINFSAMNYTVRGDGTNQTASQVTVVEITGGMITSPVDAPLTNVSSVRYWEIFYDTRRTASTAAITFTYAPVADGISNEETLELASRSDYGQNWTRHDNIVRNAVANTITASNVNLGDTHWILASTGDNSLPVELSSFTGTPTGGGILLKWQTHSETNNLGFHIYRSAAEGSEYKRITSTLISGHGTDSTTHDYEFIDDRAEEGQTYWYVVEDVDFAGEMDRSDPIRVTFPLQHVSPKALPTQFTLYQNFPNPFNPETWIPYDLAAVSSVSITIYDTHGHHIRTLALGTQPGGSYLTQKESAYWDGRTETGEFVPSGTYFYHLKAGDFEATRKMIILK